VRAPAACILAFGVAYLAIVNVLWMYNDRYYLVLLPPSIVLLLSSLPQTDRRPRLHWVPLMAAAAIAMVGSRDAFRFNLAVRETWEQMVQAGVPPSEIDAGYAWNGWALYAHPERLPAGMSPAHDVPWITSARDATYVLSTTPLRGYRVERAVTWSDLPWPGPDRVLVLRRTTHDEGR
jgi:hypothetical protein